MTNEYFNKYESLIIKVNKNENDIKYIVDFFYDNIGVDNYSNKHNFADNIMDSEYNDMYVRYNHSDNKIKYGGLIKLDTNTRNHYGNIANIYEKVFDINDIKDGTIKTLIKYGTYIPSYKPKKINRTINESNNFKNYNYNEIAVRVESVDELIKLEKKLKNEYPDRFRSIINWDYPHPNYIIINVNRTHHENRLMHLYLTDVSVDECFQDLIVDDDTVDERIYTIKDIPTIINLLKQGSFTTPNYRPKKVERTLENNDDYIKYEYNEFVVRIENKEELRKLENELRKIYPDSLTMIMSTNVYPNCFFIDPNTSHRNKELDWTRLTRDPESYDSQFQMFIIEDNTVNSDIFTINDIQDIISIVKYGYKRIPNYRPKKVERTLESIKDKIKGKSDEEILDVVKNMSGHQQFLKACKFGMLSLVKDLLENNGGDALNEGFAEATRNGHIEIVDLLLNDERIDPNWNVGKPLSAATGGGHIGVVELLLNDERIKPSENGSQSLCSACAGGYLDIVKLLLDDGRVKPYDDNNRPLSIAVDRGRLNVVKELLKYDKVDPSPRNKNIFQQAVYGKHIEVIKELLKSDKLDINHIIDTINNSALRKKITEIKSLVNDKVIKEINKIDNINDRLVFAANCGFLSLVSKYINGGADVNYKYNDTSPLKISVVNGHTRVVKKLLDSGAKIDNMKYLVDVCKYNGGKGITLKSKKNNNYKDILTLLKQKRFPMKKIRNFLSFNTNESLLLEKSSLTTLGVHREVMQSIQRDLALPDDAEWDRISLKSEVEDILQDGQKELILQIATDAVKVFVSYPENGEQIYFIDSYISKDTGWGGEYIKQKREFTTKTQLFYHIESKTLIYHLKSDFSIKKQPHREVEKKEEEFDKFTMDFKKDFLEKFDGILKRIVGSKYDDAKKEIRDKAKQIELENQMMISGLDDPLEGHNSLTILDEFLYQFEDEYSNFFDERIDLQELCNYFSREKILTSFMYFIYKNKILTK
jgi:ankyrin repeat protein